MIKTIYMVFCAAEHLIPLFPAVFILTWS